MACFEYPDFDVKPVLDQLDALAAEISKRCPADAKGRQFVTIANRYLFDELGLQGDELQYYDPRNSFLNDVLSRRRGIPITLSVIYMEVARRMGRAVNGVGLPGHFLVQYAAPDFPVFIDPFHGGRLMTREDCTNLVRERASIDLPEDSPLFAPATPREIVVRMLRNLKGKYLRAREFAKALAVSDMLNRSGVRDDSAALLPKMGNTDPGGQRGRWN